MADPLIIWGAGGHARVVTELVRRAGHYRVVAYVDDVTAAPGAPPQPGVPICRRIEEALELAGSGVVVHVAIGDNLARNAICLRAAATLTLATLVDPGALVAADVQPGPGALVAAFARICTGARIGGGAIINTGAIVEHDSKVADSAHVAPRAVIGGGADIGECTLVGLGAVVLGGVRVGARVTIGAGAVVVSDLPDGAIAYGCPARVVRIVE